MRWVWVLVAALLVFGCTQPTSPQVRAELKGILGSNDEPTECGNVALVCGDMITREYEEDAPRKLSR
jgi:hypothetical protein